MRWWRVSLCTVRPHRPQALSSAPPLVLLTLVILPSPASGELVATQVCWKGDLTNAPDWYGYQLATPFGLALRRTTPSPRVRSRAGPRGRPRTPGSKPNSRL